MKNVFCKLRIASAISAILVMGIAPVPGQEYRAPRGPDGKPDLNGIWQVLNEANYDLEAHVARPAMALRGCCQEHPSKGPRASTIRFVDGPIRRTLGGRHAGHRRDWLERSDVV
jgi:hypothetical protein